MCQYTGLCPVRLHRPRTVCRVAQARNAVAVVAVVGVVGWAAVTGGPSSSDLGKGSGGARQTPKVHQVKVVDVVDGGTLRVTEAGKQYRVRLLGVDAPEVDHGDGGGECFGDEATRVLERLTPVGSRVTLTSDSSQGDLDRYDRALRYVERGDVDVNLELLKRGAAERYGNDAGLERGEVYDRAVARAERKEKGLWGAC